MNLDNNYSLVGGIVFLTSVGACFVLFPAWIMFSIMGMVALDLLIDFYHPSNRIKKE